MKRKPYPKMSDFDIDDIHYGVAAPFVGIGVYTSNMKFSWPDPEGTTKAEYMRWVKHLRSSGYRVPKSYLGAYYEFKKKVK